MTAQCPTVTGIVFGIALLTSHICPSVVLAATPLAPGPDSSAAGSSEVAVAADVNHQVGLAVGLEPTLVTELYYRRRDGGSIGLEGSSWVRAGLAPLTGPAAFRFELERWENVLHSGGQSLAVIGGLRLSLGSDSSARYTTLGATLGARYGVHFPNSVLGFQAVYLPGLVTWMRFSEVHRQSFGDRYADARDALGPETATVGFASQRVVTALTYDTHSDNWAVWAAAGLQFSPGAGSNWASLELGQLPIYLRVLVGYRF